MNHSYGLLHDVKIVPTASATTVDLAQVEGVAFIVVWSAAAGTNKIVLEVGDTSTQGDHVAAYDMKYPANAAELTMDATATVGVLQVHKPQHRYCSITITGTTSAVLAVFYGHRKSFPAQGATTLTALFQSPIPA